MLRRALQDLVLAVASVVLCLGLAFALPGCKQQAEPPAAAAAGVTADPRPQPTPAAAPQAGPVPRAALAYRADLTRTARAVWGLDAPVPAFAAQVHQESGWNAQAVSRVGAVGLAQFMPATSRWIGDIDPQLRSNQPFSPGWALRALVTYDLWLFDRTPLAYAERDRFWVALRAYNGGLGHWQAEARKAAGASRQDVDAACGTAKRARAHCRENLDYPHRILVLLQPRYAAWGRTV